MRRKKVIWHPNDIFAIPLMDGNYAIGHALDQRMVNSLRIALYNEVIPDLENIDLNNLVKNDNLISLIEVWREHLDYGVWKIIGNKETLIHVSQYANEQFRANKWINSIVYDAGLADDFLNSYHRLLPWNDWYNPNYLDSFLIDISKKPDNLVLKKIEN